MAENDLKVILKAKELATHTLRVTSNANRYPKKFRFSLVDKMQNKSMEIYEMLFVLNADPVNVIMVKGLTVVSFHRSTMNELLKSSNSLRKTMRRKKLRLSLLALSE